MPLASKTAYNFNILFKGQNLVTSKVQQDLLAFGDSSVVNDNLMAFDSDDETPMPILKAKISPAQSADLLLIDKEEDSSSKTQILQKQDEIKELSTKLDKATRGVEEKERLLASKVNEIIQVIK